MAFESLESLHVETNDVQAFLDYCKTLGKNSFPDAKIPDQTKYLSSLCFLSKRKAGIIRIFCPQTFYYHVFSSLITVVNPCTIWHLHIPICFLLSAADPFPPDLLAKYRHLLWMYRSTSVFYFPQSYRYPAT